MFKPVGSAMKKGVAVVHAGKTIYRIVNDWVKTYKGLPESVQGLKVAVTTIVAVTEQHIRLQNTSVEPVLEAIYAELEKARDLLIAYQAAKKQTLFVKAKSFDRKLVGYTQSLQGHLEFLSTALRVSAPTEFNPTNVLRGVDDAALRFWVDSFGSVNSVPLVVFRDAVVSYAQSRFPRGYQKIAANLVVPKEYASATFTIYMFKDLVLAGEGFDMTIKSFAYTNPFTALTSTASPATSATSSINVCSEVSQQATPGNPTKAKIVFDPDLGNHFYIISRVAGEGGSGAAMCLQPANSSGGKSDNGVVIAVCRGTELQQWSFENDGGYVVNRETGLALDVEGGAFAQGARVCVSPIANRDTQNWTFNERGLVVPATCMDLCMDVDRAGNAEGTPVVLWKPDAAAPTLPKNQLWKICRNPPMLPDPKRLAKSDDEEEEEEGEGETEKPVEEGNTPMTPMTPTEQTETDK